jgi:hypothetical protein
MYRFTRMSREDLNDLLDEGRFSPFSITTHSGFSMAIGPTQRKHMVLGARMLVTMYGNGEIVHIPYNAIDHIGEVA